MVLSDPPERAGLIVIRLWEPDGAEELRARLTVHLDLNKPETAQAAAASVEDLSGAVRTWAKAFLEGRRPAGE